MDNDHNSYYYAHKADLLQALMAFFIKYWHDTEIVDDSYPDPAEYFLIRNKDLAELDDLADKVESLLSSVNY